MDLRRLFDAIDQLRASTGSFVESWGENNATRLLELETLVGNPLPPSYSELLKRFGNLTLGYIPINGLGPKEGPSSAAALTTDRREEWPFLPADALVLGEEGSDMYVLRTLTAVGVVEVRSESSRELAVFQSFESFTTFLHMAVDRAAKDAKWLGVVPESFDPWHGSKGA